MRYRPFRSIAFAAAATTSSLVGSHARADTASDIEALKSRIAQLEAQQAKADGAVAQSKAIDAAITDANSKTAFPRDSFTGGWDKGFKIQSADGAYSLQPFVEAQFRNVTNYTDSGGTTDADFENGFELRRAKFGVRGTAFTKDFSYLFRANFDRSTGQSVLELAYGQYQFTEDVGLRVGQFKLNWTHEETTPDTKQLLAERSLLNQILGGTNTSYVQGVNLVYGKDGPLHTELQFTDGDLTSNTTYNDVSATGAYQDFGVAARAEYKLFGDWNDYGDFTALKDKQDLLVAGGGVDWAEGGDGDVYRFTADAQYESKSGFAAYGSAIYTVADGDTTQATIDKSVGGLVQASYLLPALPNWEVFGRYDITHLDEEIRGERNYQEITVGVNRYFVGHSAKLTIDLGWLPSGTPIGASGLGASNVAEDQLILRGQFQLLL